MKVTLSVFSHLKRAFLHFVHYNCVPEDIERLFLCYFTPKLSYLDTGKDTWSTSTSLHWENRISVCDASTPEKMDETMKKKMKHYFQYFVFLIRPHLSGVCLCLPPHDCNQSSVGCLVDAFLMILSFLSGTNESQFFTKSIRAPTCQLLSAPNLPNNQAAN